MTDVKCDIVIYQTNNGASNLKVHLDHDTVWLTQKQMAELFGKDVRTVNEHIRNIFKEGELDDASVIRKFRITAADGKSYDTAHYNLDVIISVGYRVKSQQGTRFRQWATRVLHDHIVKGYTLNEQRLREESAKLQAMQQTVALLARTLTNREVVSDTGRDVLRVIDDYAYALATLDRYDHGTLAIEGITRQALHIIDYEEGIGIVTAMKGEFDGLFGVEKDQGFKSALENTIRRHHEHSRYHCQPPRDEGKYRAVAGGGPVRGRGGRGGDGYSFPCHLEGATLRRVRSLPQDGHLLH